MQKTVNIGILAHVDAGKTSITEQMLFQSGCIRSLGSVDKGTSQSDNLSVEKARGISIRSSSASFEWKQKKINLIDTPGHIDFSSEVERSMLALDCAILVLSAVEGVQAHALTLWSALRKMNIPTLIFINKIDRLGADSIAVIEEIKKELNRNIVVMQSAIQEGTNDANISQFSRVNSFQQLSEEFVESVLNNDEALLDRYLNNEDLRVSDILDSMALQITNKQVFPVLMGSAKFDIGMIDLMDFIVKYMPNAKGDPNASVSGIIYKVEHNVNTGRLAFVRLFDGLLENRNTVYIPSRGKEEKISQIKKLHGQRQQDIGLLNAGDIGAIYGLSNVKAGDILGNITKKIQHISLQAPLLTTKVSPVRDNDYAALVKAMQILTDEDPSIDLAWLQEERELHVKIMGLIQIEVLQNILNERFGLEVAFGSPSVIYKETLATVGEAYEEYTMPKPCWAVVKFLIEPGERASGVRYSSTVGVNQIAKRYQQETERSIPLALKQGIHGWEVTDIKITLIGGEDHNIHSRAGDFSVATPMAMMKGLQNLGSILLEPMLNFTITAPGESLGKVISGLTQLRAEVGNPLLDENKFTLEGIIPVATSLDYPAKLSAATGGKAKLSTRFSGYRECPLGLGATTPFRGINPLNRSKYILKARNAIQ